MMDVVCSRSMCSKKEKHSHEDVLHNVARRQPQEEVRVCALKLPIC